MALQLSTSAFYRIVFVLSLFLLFFVSSITYKQLESLNESERLVRLSDRINLELEQLISKVKDAEAGQRGYIITRDSSYLHPYIYAVGKLDDCYYRLDRLLRNNPEQRRNLDTLKELINERFDVLEQTLSLATGEVRVSDSLHSGLNRGKELMLDIRNRTNRMIEHESDLLEKRNNEHAENIFFTPLAALLISIFAMVVFVGSFIKINNDRKKLSRLKDEATQARIVTESERLYRELIEGLPAALYTCDNEGNIQIFNKAAARLWGREPEPGNAKWSGALKHFRADGTEMPVEECPMVNVVSTGGIFNTEMILERPDGSRRNVIPHPQPIYDAAGNKIGALNMLLDITEQKKSQKALEESELRLRLATEATHLATWDLDMETREIIYSPRLNEIFGYPAEQKREHHEMVAQLYPKDKRVFDGALKEALKSGIYFYEVRIIKPDGNIAWIRTEGKVLFNADGAPVRMLGTLLDITEERESREQIMRSERLFRSISLNIPNSLVLVFDKNYKVLTLEGDLMRKMGYDSSDYEGKYLYDLGPIEKHQAMLPFYDRVFAGETFSEERISDETGETFMVHFVPMRNEEDEIYAALLIALDITEFKKVEDKIGMLGAIVESSEDAIVSKTLDGTVTSWNKGAERIFGYTEEEMIGKPISMIIPPDRMDEEPHILDRIKSGKRVNHFETKRMRKDGTVIDISLTLSPLKNSDGEVIGVSKIARDVTTQKKAERLLIESEERFRTLIDAAPVLVWMSGTDKQFDFFNKAWLDFTGRAMEQEVGTRWQEGIHPEDIDRYLEKYTISFDKREEFYVEYRLRRYDGIYRWVSDKGIPRFSPDGTFLGYIGGGMDIQQQKSFANELGRQVLERTEELNNSNREMRQQKEFAEMILDTSIDITIVYDTEMRFISFNKAAEEKYGLNKKDVLGRTLLEIYPQLEGSQGYNDVLRALNGETVHNTKYHSPITNLYYEDYFIPLKNSRNQVYAVLVIARDITETIRNEELLMHLNESLTSKNTELERSNTELASFNHVASHDLQEPLRKIQTFISRIQEKDLDRLSEKGVEYFAKVQSSANRMQKLIDDLLTFSRTNKADQQHESVDLNITLENVLRELGPTIEEKGAVIEADPLPVLDGIAFQFQQLFINLIGNAMKYSKPDVKPYIRVRSEIVAGSELSSLNAPADRRFYMISVSDNGIGFDPKYARQIFELFQRLHGKMEYTGTGIGLTICKKIVENHNGYITAKGEPGEGSVFTIYLPV
jgi:PAS domain S-box-containing protein